MDLKNRKELRLPSMSLGDAVVIISTIITVVLAWASISSRLALIEKAEAQQVERLVALEAEMKQLKQDVAAGKLSDAAIDANQQREIAVLTERLAHVEQTKRK